VGPGGKKDSLLFSRQKEREKKKENPDRLIFRAFRWGEGGEERSCYYLPSLLEEGGEGTKKKKKKKKKGIQHRGTEILPDRRLPERPEGRKEELLLFGSYGWKKKRGAMARFHTFPSSASVAWVEEGEEKGHASSAPSPYHILQRRGQREKKEKKKKRILAASDCRL